MESCPGNLKIVAKMPVKPENIDRFKTLATELVEASRQEEGNVYYSLNISKKDPNTFAFVECWRDKAAIKTHNATEHFTRILPQLRALCDGHPESEIYTEL